VKERPRSDYPVRVRPRKWDEDPQPNELFEGIYDVTLNFVVDITFVPAVTLPYDHALLPEAPDDITTSEQARLWAILFAGCAVTPDDALAGTKAALPPVTYGDGQTDSGVVVYVTGEQFERLAADLEAFGLDLFDLHSTTPVSELRGHPVIDFVETLVADLDEPMLRDP
jgi:hypothetical protein